MLPFVGESFLVEATEERFHLSGTEQTRPGRNQEPDRVLDRINVVNQAAFLYEIQDVYVVLQGSPGSE